MTTKFICDDADFFGTLISKNDEVTVIKLDQGGTLELPTEEIIATRKVEAQPVVKQNSTASKKGSKKERAIELFKKHPGATRGTMIDIFMAQLEMTKAGASTYYAAIKKELA